MERESLLLVSHMEEKKIFDINRVGRQNLCVPPCYAQ